MGTEGDYDVRSSRRSFEVTIEFRTRMVLASEQMSCQLSVTAENLGFVGGTSSRHTSRRCSIKPRLHSNPPFACHNPANAQLDSVNYTTEVSA